MVMSEVQKSMQTLWHKHILGPCLHQIYYYLIGQTQSQEKGKYTLFFGKGWALQKHAMKAVCTERSEELGPIILSTCSRERKGPFTQVAQN